MTDRRPEPGSPWARHCPDAWPREWLDARGELPPGFARPADPHEAELITGRIDERAFLRAAGRESCPGPSPKKNRAKGRQNPVVRKLLGYRRFYDELLRLPRPLPPGAVAAWGWLWSCEESGRTRCSARRLGRRLGVSKSTAARWLTELVAVGFVRVVRAGVRSRSPTVVRVSPRPVLGDVQQQGRGPQKASTGAGRPTDGTPPPHRRDTPVPPVGHDHSSTS